MPDPMRSTRGTVGNRISTEERRLLQHISMWGSDGYPIVRRGRKWFIDGAFGVPAHPGTFDTKRAATEAFERFLNVLRDASGQEAYERAVAESGAA